MKDYIVRATAAGGTVRVFAAVTTNMVEKARITHDLSPVATAALGRTLTAIAMMSLMLKNESDTITLQIKGDGPLGGIITVADGASKIRGYVNNPKVFIPLNNEGKLDVASAVGKKGYLNLIRDMGLKEPYIGFVDLISGEIAEDISYYFAHSEQIPTALALGVLVDTDESVISAGGYLIQLMPDADEGLINYIENTIRAIPSITEMISYGETPETIMEILFGEKDLIISDRTETEYVCSCSREKMERNLISLGVKEIQDIIDEQHSAELVCHFCNSTYNFNETELKKLVREIKKK
ncbi:MAG: Hsp33 family molecular chaperone HslO [Clostridia bacterium]|jgi:molecular chaperone Hsp33